MEDPKAAAALEELEASEAAYVNSMGTLCDALSTLRCSGTLTKEDEEKLFCNIETIRGINEELLRRLRSGERSVAHAASVFSTMAPFLKGYSEYCANFVAAQESMGRLLKAKKPLEAAVREAEVSE